MANYRRNGPRGRAKRQAEQRRLRLIVFGGTAAVVLIAVLAALLLPRGGAPDRAAYQPVEGVLQAEGEPLVPQAPAANADKDEIGRALVFLHDLMRKAHQGTLHCVLIHNLRFLVHDPNPSQ